MVEEHDDTPPGQPPVAGGGEPGLPEPGRSRRGRVRSLDYGDIRLLALQLIAERPRHGYDLIRAIAAEFKGSYTPSPGIIYPTLVWLAGAGLVEGTVAGARKSHAVTPAGLRHLEQNAAEIARMRSRMLMIRRNMKRAPPPEVVAAMDRLKAALRQQLGGGTATADEIARIAAQIDRAAAAIRGTPDPG